MKNKTKSKNLPKVVLGIPKEIARGAKSRVNPNDFNSSGIQYREIALMPFLNESVRTLRNVWEMTKLIRLLARIEGPISTAIFNFVQVADSDYTIEAYDAVTGHYDQDGTDLAQSILDQIDMLPTATGYNDKNSFQTLRQMMLREVVITNGVGCEMVLNKAYLPDYFQLVGLETLKWFKKDDGYIPKQFQQGSQVNYTSLDIPNFFVQRAVGDPTDILPRSMMEAAVKMLIFFEEVIEDIRKTLKQTGYARNVITLDLDKIKAAAPRQILQDAVKFSEFCETIRQTVEKTIRDIDPDEALVLFNTAEFSIESSQFGKNIDYTPLMSQISGMYATSMKTPPTVLGMRIDSGSQALGNVETLIFLKAARSIQLPVNTVISRMLTLGCRLAGKNVMVRYRYDDIDLRPEIETEAFKQMRQTRILQQLSTGFISDERAATLLKTGRRPPGAPALSGTMFNVQAIAPTQTDGTNTANSKQPTSGDNPAGRTLQPDKGTPRKAGGSSQ